MEPSINHRISRRQHAVIRSINILFQLMMPDKRMTPLNVTYRRIPKTAPENTHRYRSKQIKSTRALMSCFWYDSLSQRDFEKADFRLKSIEMVYSNGGSGGGDCFRGIIKPIWHASRRMELKCRSKAENSVVRQSKRWEENRIYLRFSWMFLSRFFEITADYFERFS